MDDRDKNSPRTRCGGNLFELNCAKMGLYLWREGAKRGYWLEKILSVCEIDEE